MNTTKCAGCNSLLNGLPFLKCSRCSDKYHCSCVNFKKQISNEFSKEFKDSWICPLCRCKEPKHGDNTNTPIRSATNSTLKFTMDAAPPAPSAVAASEYDNVTLRTRPRSSCNCSCISVDSIRDILREELDRKFNAQFSELQLKLANLEKSLTTHHAQHDRLCRENESQKTLILDMKKVDDELRTTTDDLTRRVCLLELRSCTNNIVSKPQPEPSELPAPISSDEDSASQRQSRQRRRKVRNNIVIYSPNSNREMTPNSFNVLSKSVGDPYLDLEQVPTQTLPSLKTATKAGTSAPPTNVSQWVEVRHKTKRHSLSLRCLAGPTVTSLRAVEPRKFIHLWNMLSSADEIKQYLNELCPLKAFTVEELKTKNNYKSFKIGVPEDCFERCFSVDIWPDNARVKKWVNYAKRAPVSQQFQREVGGQRAGK